MLIIQLHIPRTGGGSTTAFLRKLGLSVWGWNIKWNLPSPLPKQNIISRATQSNGDVFAFDSDDPLVINFKLSADENVKEVPMVNGLGCIEGHIPYGVHRYISMPCKYLTTIRNGAERAWSWYRNAWVARGSNHPESVRWESLYRFDINKIVRAKEPALYNDQVRMILGTKKIDLDESDLQEALDIIESNNFCYVTVTERLPEMAKELGQLFKSNINPRMPRDNLGNHPKIPDDVRALLSEYNQLDQKLYTYVKEKEAIVKPWM